MFKNIRRIIETIASIWAKNMLGYLPLDIIFSSKLTVFLELRSRKIVPISEEIMSADKYPTIFLPQMEAIVYLTKHLQWLCVKDGLALRTGQIEFTVTVILGILRSE